MMHLWEFKDDIQYRKGVGPRRAESLRRMGIETAGDLVAHLPRAHEDRTRFTPIVEAPLAGESVLLKAVIERATLKRLRGRFSILSVLVSDGTGRATLLWYNQPFLQKKMTAGTWIIITGTVKRGGLIPEITVRDYEFLGLDEEADALAGGRITPIYPLTTGLSAGWMRREIFSVLKSLPTITDPIPALLLSKRGLIDFDTSLRTIHFPSSFEELERARRRLAFDEFLMLQLRMARRRFERETHPRARRYSLKGEPLRRIHDRLGFKLTEGQRCSLEEIRSDLLKGYPMNRLLQGDVGSGKTAVAILAAALAAESGFQTAFMVPSEIVAEQHYQNWRGILADAGIQSALLTSSVKGRERAAIKEAVQRGDCALLFGTHALLEEDVSFARLSFVVIDEQHRFGVLQRRDLIEKGESPDVLVLTATPIPRTLAMTLYGDLEVSTIRERPAGRSPVMTVWLAGGNRSRMMELLHKELSAGNRIFFVYPLVEESEKIDLKNAKEQSKKIQEAFPDHKVGLVTGRLKGEEKNEIMRDFKSGKIHILVATTVVEVGVDVPEATVMVIEHAERFGLAQLHQLRGRVGRGHRKSFCVLTSAPESELTLQARRRLETLVKTDDGFKIAEEDLLLRGPGEFIGLRQHGLPELKVARLVGDEDVLKASAETAREIILTDPELAAPQYSSLRDWLAHAKKEVEVGTA